MSRVEPIASPEILRPFRTAATSKGVGDELLVQAGCPVDPDSTAEFPERLLWRYFAFVDRTSADWNFGLVSGDQFRLTDFGSFGRGLELGLTLHQTIQRLVETVGSVSSHAQFWLADDKHDQNFVWLCRDGMRRLAEFDVGRRQAEQFTVLMMLKLIRQAAGDSWRPSHVSLQMAPDESLEDHEAFAKSTLRFNAECTAIAVPRRMLALTNLSWQADPTSAEWRNRLSLFWNGSPPLLDEAAAMLGTSPRTLQRRLHDDGLTYEAILDQMRLERAVDLLGTPMTLVEVASRVGYADQAHFTRAFKRWTGITPGAWRQPGDAPSLPD